MVEPLVSALMLGGLLGGYTLWSRLRDRQVDTAWSELAETLHLVGDERRLTGRIGEVVLELVLEEPEGCLLSARIPGRPLFQLLPLADVNVTETRALRTGDGEFDRVYWANRQSAHALAVLTPTVRRQLVESGGRVRVEEGRVSYRWGARPTEAATVLPTANALVDLAARLGVRSDAIAVLAARLPEEPVAGVRLAALQLLRKQAPVSVQLDVARALLDEADASVVRLVEGILMRHGTPEERFQVASRRAARHPGNAGAVSLSTGDQGALSVSGDADATGPDSE